jgi:hypothetical protein
MVQIPSKTCHPEGLLLQGVPPYTDTRLSQTSPRHYRSYLELNHAILPQGDPQSIWPRTNVPLWGPHPETPRAYHRRINPAHITLQAQSTNSILGSDRQIHIPPLLPMKLSRWMGRHFRQGHSAPSLHTLLFGHQNQIIHMENRSADLYPRVSIGLIRLRFRQTQPCPTPILHLQSLQRKGTTRLLIRLKIQLPREQKKCVHLLFRKPCNLSIKLHHPKMPQRAPLALTLAATPRPPHRETLRAPF